MLISESVAAFEAHVQSQGQTLEGLAMTAAAEAMATFFEGTKAEGLAAYGGEEDMLIGEWGPAFQRSGIEVILSRQWIEVSGAIWQLQLRLHYPAHTLAAGSTDWQLQGADFVSKLAPLKAALADAEPPHTHLALHRM